MLKFLLWLKPTQPHRAPAPKTFDRAKKRFGMIPENPCQVSSMQDAHSLRCVR